MGEKMTKFDLEEALQFMVEGAQEYGYAGTADGFALTLRPGGLVEISFPNDEAEIAFWKFADATNFPLPVTTH